MVNLTIRVLTRPDVAHLPLILSTLGTAWDDRVLPSIVEETLKSVIVRPSPGMGWWDGGTGLGGDSRKMESGGSGMLEGV